MRIYEFARLKGIPSKQILDICHRLGWKLKKSFSGLSPEEQNQIETYLNQEKSKNQKEAGTATTTLTEEKRPRKHSPVKEKVQTSPAQETTGVRTLSAEEKTVTAQKEELIAKKIPLKKIEITGTESVGQLAAKFNLKPAALLARFLQWNIPLTSINDRPGIENVRAVAEKMGMEVTVQEAVEPVSKKVVAYKPRAPVVTIMGHVDHGKTTILDAIRKSRLAQREFGQITQKIGAYRVNLPQGSIVFLDTPGHEAFTAMRARGARVTDLVVLVVAADEGVKPQTVEAINHAKSANVPIIVAVNKIDKPNANVQQVRKQLAEYGLVPDNWGGDTVFVNLSALTGEGLNELLDMILLVGEMLELKADPACPGEGIVIESQLDHARGPVLSVLIQNGTVRVGESFVAGPAYGRIRALIDDTNNRLSEAEPSTPVEILGASQIVSPGTKFAVVASEKEARELAEKNAVKSSSPPVAGRRITVEELYQQTQQSTKKELKIVLKADCLGSVEAIRTMLEKQKSDLVQPTFLHCAAGPITEGDILLAAASKGMVIGFNVPFGERSSGLAKQEGVEVKIYRLIYDLAEDIKNLLEGLLEPEKKEVLVGQALVKKVFQLSKGKVVAGCLVVDGKVQLGSRTKVIREGKIIHEGTLITLKRFKETVKEVGTNTECGMEIAGFKEFKEGDIIQSVRIEQVVRPPEKNT